MQVKIKLCVIAMEFGDAVFKAVVFNDFQQQNRWV